MSGRLEAAVEAAASVPGAFGAILCDFEGESVIARLGPAQIPPEAVLEARRHVPQGLCAEPSLGEFLLRLAGAEPCALLAHFGRSGERVGAGSLGALELGFERVGLLVITLPEDYYLVTVIDRRVSAGLARARRLLETLRPMLEAELR